MAVRDQMGIRVLYIHQTASLLTIATAPKALFTIPSVPRRLRETKIADWLLVTGDQTSTFYQGIDYLPSAHVLCASSGGSSVRCYWLPDLSRRIQYPRDNDYVEAFAAVFEQSVRCRLLGRAPVGAFMSGGLDSSSVAVVAADQLAARGERLTVFTHVPPEGFHGPADDGRYNDESPLVEAVRDRNGNMDLRYLRGEGKTLFGGIERFFEVTETPMVAASNRFWLEQGVETARRLGIRVLMGGDRGNLTISFDGRHRLRELALSGRWSTLLGELRAMARGGRFSLYTLFRHLVLAPLLPSLVWSLRECLRPASGVSWSRYSALNPALAKTLNIEERLRAAGRGHPSGIVGDGRGQRMAPLRNGIVNDAAAIAQAWRSAFGVGLSDPTGDLRVVEYCLALPLDQYLRNGRSRNLIRRAMEGRLPPSVLNNTLRGNQAADWYLRLTAIRGEIAAELDRLERNDTARRCLDLPRMRYLVDNWPQGNWTNGEVRAQYDLLLSRGLMMGRFIRWFEER